MRLPPEAHKQKSRTWIHFYIQMNQLYLFLNHLMVFTYSQITNMVCLVGSNQYVSVLGMNYGMMIIMMTALINFERKRERESERNYTREVGIVSLILSSTDHLFAQTKSTTLLLTDFANFMLDLFNWTNIEISPHLIWPPNSENFSTYISSTHL